MNLASPDFSHGSVIPEAFAFCAPDPESQTRAGGNRNPELNWTRPPDGTRSFVLICVDTDVPTAGDDVNKQGRTVPADLPRTDFYHWVMVDIPSATRSIGGGSASSGVTAGGKRAPEGPAGARQGINDYTSWFAGDPDMAGDYFGYDGPCPPWNDALVHHYRFRLYATDLENCPVTGKFTGKEVEAALSGHVLAMDELTGIYTLNQDVSV